MVTWTKQIKNVLKADPDVFLKDPSSYPGPLTELNYWTERAANLNSIHDQLMGDKIQKVVKVLELAVSTYYPAFKRCVFGPWGLCACAHVHAAGVHAASERAAGMARQRGRPSCGGRAAPLPCSVVHSVVRRLFKEAELARQEANDNVKFLKPLRK